MIEIKPTSLLDQPTKLENAGQVQSNADLSAAAEVARRVFGYGSLRPSQEEVLSGLLQGRDTLAVIPTGAGKSLCYTLPSLMGEGLGLVISPLISLIRDQVLRLRKDGVAAASLDSMQTSEERQQVMQALRDRKVKVLFVSPERLSSSSFKLLIDEQQLRLIAIDEAHCISQWGANFRPEYRKIGDHLKDLTSVPVIALTATATKEVRQEIVAALGMDDPKVVIKEPTRDVLQISVEQSPTQAALITSIIDGVRGESGQGLIYCATRKMVEKIYEELRQVGVSCSRYHAGLYPGDREQCLSSFLAGEHQVVVATNAFGLGVDKADIRFVYHAGIPKSIEQYVQEIGRAGRDGLDANCTLFHMKRDFYVHKFMIEKEFVDLSSLKTSWELIESAFSSDKALNEIDLVSFVCEHSQIPRSEASHCLQVFQREGWIIGGSFAGERGGGYLSIGLPLAMDQFLDYYQSRAAKTMDRLNAMIRYAELQSGYKDFINQYFEV